jgi:2-polyprenyl-3-methyl-5-hydroxy-6-metoxy-1,4-benzoquinol methylase
MGIGVPQAILKEIRSILADDQFLEVCARRLSHPKAEIVSRIEISLGEAAVGLSLLEGINLTGKRVLEVGAGMGIVSLVLNRQGVEVMPIEPGRGVFDPNAQIGFLLRERLNIRNLAYLSLGAEELRPADHGHFDVIFSVNVFEHVSDLESVVDAMCKVIKPSGVMRHTCPNYLIPYEPHFGVLLVPFVPRLTALLLPHARGTELWDSLNFVTLGQMRRAFSRHGFVCEFARGTMHKAFVRLDADEKYRERQGSRQVVAVAYSLLRRLRLLRLIASLPPVLATPMTFEVRRKDGNAI